MDIKFLGRYELIFMHFLGCFKVVFGCMYFLNVPKHKLPQVSQKRVGGESRPLLENFQNKAVFFLGLLPLVNLVQ